MPGSDGAWWLAEPIGVSMLAVAQRVTGTPGSLSGTAELSCIFERESRGWIGVFVHGEGVPGARVSGTAVARGSRAAAHTGGNRGVLGLCRAGELEKGVQPEERAQKEEAWKVLCACGGEGQERSLSLQMAV